ncbi:MULTISPECIES: hypothetical protein [Citrobacter]|uniref:hypothetical protein n=1 Tax=Citrobacter TaxID=544 RepID=UPI000F51880B|nr:MULTISPECIES: hypothetical protein [Citrobacter]MDM3329605.1 hypothetical protein [Citrobacter sp. Cb130]MEB2418205.1 hypothetical protein [Citrobacter sp. R-1.5.2]RPH24322.1 hypothetical protein EHN13_13545 [Citrobacter youngae]
MDITFSDAQVLNSLMGHSNFVQLTYSVSDLWLTSDSVVVYCSSFQIAILRNDNNNVINVINLRSSACVNRETIIVPPIPLITTCLQNELSVTRPFNMSCNEFFDASNNRKPLGGYISIQ